MHKRAGRSVVWVAAVATAAALSTSALAQPSGAKSGPVTPGRPSASAAPAVPAGQATPPGQPAPPSQGDPAKPEAPKAPVRPMGGYGYSDKPTRRVGRPHAQVVRSGPSASFPAFAAADGGGSRLSVQLSAPVQVEELRAAGSITYVLKGAHVRRHNDTHPLVTVHFNTPVREAHLVMRGADLHLVVELRAPSTPSFKVSPGQGGAATLEIDFPKGEFLPPDAEAPGAAPAAPERPTPAAPPVKPAEPRAPEPKP